MPQSGIGAADELFHLVALTITLSIVAYASTDVVVARLFDAPDEVRAWRCAGLRRGHWRALRL